MERASRSAAAARHFHELSRKLIFHKSFPILFISTVSLSGCFPQPGCLATLCGGPERLIPTDQELQPIAMLDDYYTIRQSYLSAPTLDAQKSIRNNFIFERVYAMDVKYTAYEENLTKESQDEGFWAAVTNAALTGTGALIPVAQTTRLLSGIAAGLTTTDQAYNKQFLLNKAVQLLQSQMRARRAEIMTNIIARSKYSVIDYPLGMAMSDLEEYYRAGTLSAAFIDLSEGVATNADVAKSVKDQIKPGAPEVAQAITNVNAPLSRLAPRAQPGAGFEATLTPKDVADIREAMCLPRAGSLDANVHANIAKYLASKGQASPPSAQVDPRTWILLNRLIKAHQKADCTLFS
jgi:hypothetical protein